MCERTLRQSLTEPLGGNDRAVGVNSDGRREVLGMDIGPSEAETFCTAFCASWRGLHGVKLVVSDSHELRLGSAAAFASCAMHWPMPAEAVGALSPPSSPPPSPRTTLQLPASNGAGLPISSGRP